MNQSEFTEKERKEWDEFVEEARRRVLQPMVESAVVLQLHSPASSREPDVWFALQIGLSLLLDKPLLMIVMPEAKVPERLIQVADMLVYADVDTQEGQEKVAAAIQEMRNKL